ncbi:MAG: AAA family ATPase [Polyangiaceae bacterium]|nr:AAA family ATPase [Polyangiaceae bacterium]
MRLSTDPDRDDDRSIATIAAAIVGGASILDTAPSYGLGEHDAHHNERLVARALAAAGSDHVDVCTKGGLVREGTQWVPDGRKKAIRAACEASREALGARAIDLYLLHTVDPATPLEVSARALADLLEAGLVNAVGLSNVTVGQIEEARRHVPVSVVQVAVGPYDDAALRGGVVRYCRSNGIEVHAHSPFGGPRRAARIGRDADLVAVAAMHGTTPWGAVVAYLASLGIVALPGTRVPERARALVEAARIELEEAARERLAARFGDGSAPRTTERRDGEIVLLMGMQAAGKSDQVQRWESLGYERLNRDEMGGTLRGLAKRLDERAAAGGTRFVLDNTYTTRASRAEVVRVAARHGLAVRCIFVDTPIESAQVLAVERLAERYGELPSPEKLRALSKKDPQAFLPTVQLRARRELEPPSEDEGFAAIERLAFERRARPWEEHPGLVVELKTWLALSTDAATRLRDELGPHRTLVFAWKESGTVEEAIALARDAAATSVLGNPDVALCPHQGGPPSCWCRPPLPGLVVPWLREHAIDPRRSSLIGSHGSHQAMARALGFRAP